jgi:RimJ/RimL family protein N-acetyltransferase/ubiquinone/menaquinone biosynthesis C-methylase UbiE
VVEWSGTVVLTTPRLLLRTFRRDDLPSYAALNADPEVARYLGGPLSREDSDDIAAWAQECYAREGLGLLAVERREDGAFLGMCGLHHQESYPDDVEVAWRLAREHWGHGYATEAATGWLDHAFGTLHLPRVISMTDPPNLRSLAVMRRLGMVFDHEAEIQDMGMVFQVVVYAITNEQWRRRVRRVDYDAELQLHDEVLGRRYNIRADDRVLDIGCGTGRTTRDAARSAGEGSALGVDVSASMIERARELAREEGLHNVAFEQGDAQVHRFPEGGFDLAISRFGTMFFDDPAAAFANIAVALRPAGRLVMMVWREHELNEWSVAIERALGREGPPVPAQEAREAFSLADQDTVEAILGAAGFAEVTFTDVHQPVYYGPDVAAALEWVGGFSSTRELLVRLDAPAAEQALERLRATLAAHASEGGVWFDSRAWIVEARRP